MDMDTVVNKVISRDGTAIAYQQFGSGPAIVLVGGAFCDRNFAAPLAGLLAADFTVICYDRRGRGDSGDTLPYAVSREVQDLDALIAAAGGSAHLFGVSSGAILCVEAAADGLEVAGLGLVEPPYPVDGGRQIPNLADEYTELCESGRRGEAVELFMTKAVGQPPEAVDEARATPMWPALEAMAHTLAYDATITTQGLPSVERAAAATAPALGIASTGSPPWLRAGAKAIAQLLPYGRYLELEGEFHQPRADLVAAELRRTFLG
jgi:pimeloyl-ACP methyl ester carboxylesterase